MTGSSNDAASRPGYYLSEDAQYRLERLRVFMRFIARLAEPRTSADDPPQLDWHELQFCMEQLAEQIDSVMAALDWPARREGMDADATATQAAEPVSSKAETAAALEATAAAPVHGTPAAAPPSRAEPAPAASTAGQDADGEPYHFGVTLDQADALGRLVQTLSAHGDIIASGHEDDLADATLPALGQAISDDADAVRELLDQIEAQTLELVHRPRRGVEEPRPGYMPGVAHLAQRSSVRRAATPAYRVH
ncbi:hypothetical protein [Luteimonas sp. FCS-9]|uniref:XAC0095 family protein n=1 Tax=Luteimonas sp. FCS-9 TaxID=1547516 RepID=UPI000ADDE2F8|nr:hypothetical protein [Luteimonas sp. FCS-9]